MFDERLHSIAEAPRDVSANQSTYESQICEETPPQTHPTGFQALVTFIKSFYQAAETVVIEIKADAKKAIEVAARFFKSSAEEVVAASKAKKTEKKIVVIVERKKEKEAAEKLVVLKESKTAQIALGISAAPALVGAREAVSPLLPAAAAVVSTASVASPAVLPLVGAALCYGADWSLPARETTFGSIEGQAVRERAKENVSWEEVSAWEALALADAIKIGEKRGEIRRGEADRIELAAAWVAQTMGVSLGLGSVAAPAVLATTSTAQNKINLVEKESFAQTVVSEKIFFSDVGSIWNVEGYGVELLPSASASAAAGFLVMIFDGLIQEEGVAPPLVVLHPAFLPVQHVRPSATAAALSLAAQENEKVLPKQASPDSREKGNDTAGDQGRQHRDQPHDEGWEEESLA